MKKFFNIHTLMAAFIMMSAMLAHGMQQVSKVVKTGKEYAGATRDALIQEFNESINRLRRCVIERSCSRWEALRMGGDLLILIGGLYLGATTIKKIGTKPIGTLSINDRFFYDGRVWKITGFFGDLDAVVKSVDGKSPREGTIPLSTRVEPIETHSIEESIALSPGWHIGDKVIYTGEKFLDYSGKELAITAIQGDSIVLWDEETNSTIIVPKTDVKEIEEE